MIRLAFVVLLLLGSSFLSSPARAQDASARREAAELANRGYDKFTRGDYDEAIALFEQAEKLSHSPVILSFIAQSHEKLGRLIEAEQDYARVVNEKLDEDAPEDFVKAQRQARRQVPILERRIPRLVMRISGVPADQVEVTLDGEPLDPSQLDTPLRVNPGARRVVLRVEGQEPIERTIRATERQLTDVDLLLATKVVERRVPTYVELEPTWVPPTIAYAVGLSGLTLGITAGALYIARADALRDRCPNRRCAPELEGEKDAIDSIGIASAVGLSIGVAGAAVGTVLLLVGDGDDGAEVEVGAGLGSVSVTGRF